jgi:hypothetical protein
MLSVVAYAASLALPSVVFASSGGSGSVAFVPLHTYFMSPTGSDSNAGTSVSAPWLTPNHALHCGDVIIAAAGSYTGQFGDGNWGTVSNCPSTSGGIDGTGGIYFAVVLCAGPDLESCKVNTAQNNSAFDIDSRNYWAVEGFKITNNGPDTSNAVRPAFYMDAGAEGSNCGAIYHHFAFVNNVVYNSQAAWGNGCGAGSGGIDYAAAIGNVAQNSAQGNPGSWYCVAAYDIVTPHAFNTAPGTHFFIYGNFALNNTRSCPSDVESYMFDTWDYYSYANQGVIQNNVAVLSGRHNIQIFEQNFGKPQTPIYILNNTLIGSSQLGTASPGINLQRGGGTPFDYTYNVTIQSNIDYEQTSVASYAYCNCMNNPEFTPTIGGSGSLTNFFLGNYPSSCGGVSCSAITYSSPLGTNTYSSPSFNNVSDLTSNRMGTPSCGKFTNTTACMGYNANTETLTNPSVLYDIQPTASGTSGVGYQLPSMTCAANSYYPTWLKGIIYLHWNGSSLTENADLVTKPCGM